MRIADCGSDFAAESQSRRPRSRGRSPESRVPGQDSRGFAHHLQTKKEELRMGKRILNSGAIAPIRVSFSGCALAFRFVPNVSLPVRSALRHIREWVKSRSRNDRLTHSDANNIPRVFQSLVDDNSFGRPEWLQSRREAWHVPSWPIARPRPATCPLCLRRIPLKIQSGAMAVL